MKAVYYQGRNDVRFGERPDPEIVDDRDALVRVELTSVGALDLAGYRGLLPTLAPGRVLGREFLGIVEEVGEGVSQIREGDRVLIPAAISCGDCTMCRRELTAQCLTSNPVGTGAAIFGGPDEAGGFDGGQSEIVRIPFADTTACVIPSALTNEQALFAGDALAAGFSAARAANVNRNDVVAVWGSGAVGLFAQAAARLSGAARVFAIDAMADRLDLAERLGAERIDLTEEPATDGVLARTQGRGADVCIEAVGFEGPRGAAESTRDPVEDPDAHRPLEPRFNALYEAVQACTPTGTIVALGLSPKTGLVLPMGPFVDKGLRLLGGGVSARALIPELFDLIARGRLDPTLIITHRGRLDAAPRFYDLLDKGEDGCIKVVLRP